MNFLVNEVSKLFAGARNSRGPSGPEMDSTGYFEGNLEFSSVLQAGNTFSKISTGNHTGKCIFKGNILPNSVSTTSFTYLDPLVFISACFTLSKYKTNFLFPESLPLLWVILANKYFFYFILRTGNIVHSEETCLETGLGVTL